MMADSDMASDDPSHKLAQSYKALSSEDVGSIREALNAAPAPSRSGAAAMSSGAPKAGIQKVQKTVLKDFFCAGQARRRRTIKRS